MERDKLRDLDSKAGGGSMIIIDVTMFHTHAVQGSGYACVRAYCVKLCHISIMPLPPLRIQIPPFALPHHSYLGEYP